MVRFAFVSLALTSCYTPDLADCTVTCAADSDCGGGQRCSPAGICAREGESCAAIVGVDASASIEPDAALDPDASAPDPDAPPAPPDAPPEPTTTMLRVKIKDKGKVTPAGFAACTAGECLYHVALGQAITLTAVPNPNRIFEKWEEACAGQLPTCTITPTGSTNVTAKFKKP